MLFNSDLFVFVFLPIALAGFYLVGRTSRDWALRWLIVISLLFYAWWRPLNVAIIAPSIIINFGLARWLQRLLNATKPRAAQTVLALGIAFNVAFLGFFKYTNFFAQASNDAFGTHLVLARIILPLGISFITFQKIAFLVDIHARRVEQFTMQDYCLFVLFFPQLIAGPIVHYREMMPQFRRTTAAFDKENAAVGVTLFAIGLFKKVVLADSIAPHVSPLYNQAAAGATMTLFPAWMAALGFTLQIYFDFSGYTDMALGLGRFFGVKFPSNFNSPLKAPNIIDFWLRWHISLTRFLTAYIYNPLALQATRRRLAKGRPPFGGRHTTLGGFVQVMMFPTLVTMLISGFWHGAGYMYILWGLLHGAYLTINHAWRHFVARRWTNRAAYDRVMRPTGFVVTFVAVVVGMVIFRSTNTTAASGLLQGVLGMHGIALPSTSHRLARLAARFPSINENILSAGAFKSLAMWIVALSSIALLLPNTLQILSRYEPALGVKPIAESTETPLSAAKRVARLAWSPTLIWAIGISLLAAIGVYNLGGDSEFLYWQF